MAFSVPVTVTPVIGQPAVTIPTPGYKTSEFWMSLAAVVLTALFAGGIIPTTGAISTVAGIVATLLTALGYTVTRGALKAAHVRGAASALDAIGTTINNNAGK